MGPKARLEAVHRAISQLQRLTDLFQQRRAKLATQMGLTEQQWRVLEEISTEHFIPSLFARLRESSPAAVSKITRQLLTKKLVRVSVSHDDGRQRQYELTAKGRRLMEGLRARRQRAIDAIWMKLEPDALALFNHFSGQLIASIEQYAKEEEQGP